jgi:hypothetical protein
MTIPKVEYRILCGTMEVQPSRLLQSCIRTSHVLGPDKTLNCRNGIKTTTGIHATSSSHLQARAHSCSTKSLLAQLYLDHVRLSLCSFASCTFAVLRSRHQTFPSSACETDKNTLIRNHDSRGQLCAKYVDGSNCQSNYLPHRLRPKEGTDDDHVSYSLLCALGERNSLVLFG